MMREPQRKQDPSSAIQNPADEVTETRTKPTTVSGHSIVEDLVQLLEDLAED